jgi:hypothetical protein
MRGVIWPTREEHRVMWTNEGPSLYWDSEKQTIVLEGDSRAAWLLVATGGQLPLEEAERYGLTDDRKKAAEAEKAAAAKANKAKSAPDNKAKGE